MFYNHVIILLDLIYSKKYTSQRQTETRKIHPNLNTDFFTGFYYYKVKLKINTMLLALFILNLANLITFKLVILWRGCQVMPRSTLINCISKLHKSSYWAYQLIRNIACLYFFFNGFPRSTKGC